MNPETVRTLAEPVRQSLHHAAWLDALLRPSLMPVVPRLERGQSAAETRHAMDVRKFRDLLEIAIFPEDEPDA